MAKVKFRLQDLGYSANKQIQLHCDNKAACDMTYNHVHHVRMKHVEVD